MSSRTKVMNGNASQTSGGLTSGDLKYNSKNRIVSAAKSDNARSGPLAVWRKVCADYLQGGEFTKIPMKGTAAYNKLIMEYHSRLGR